MGLVLLAERPTTLQWGGVGLSVVGLNEPLTGQKIFGMALAGLGALVVQLRRG